MKSLPSHYLDTSSHRHLKSYIISEAMKWKEGNFSLALATDLILEIVVSEEGLYCSSTRSLLVLFLIGLLYTPLQIYS